MNIGVDVRPLIYPGTGNANFLYNILKEVILNSKKNWNWKFFSHKVIHKEFSEILTEQTELYISSSLFPKFGPIWLHFSLPKLLKKYKIDLFWEPLFLLPLNFKKRISIPALLNIHDLNAWLFPDTMKKWESLNLKIFTKNSIQNADEVFCLSLTTKNLILEIFHRDLDKNSENKLKVIYPGIIEPPTNRKKPYNFTINEEFFLAVGTLEPRKNFDTLIKAYLEAKKEFTYLPPLVIAGKPGWKMNYLLKELANHRLKKDNIFFIHSPKKEELFWLYENCLAFFYPSIYEGFGLQILEAAYFGKFQVISKIPIFQEIGNYIENIEYVEDPLNTFLWKEKFLMFSNKNKKNNNKSKNNLLYSIFNYQQSAKKIIEIIEKYDHS